MTSVTYGATEQTSGLSRSVNRTVSFELYDEDDDYEYLPMPEVDEDFLDDVDAVELTASGNSVRREVQKRIPFSRIHQEPLPFDSPHRLCFLPGQTISFKIVKVDTSDHTQLLNHNLYVIEVSHGEYKWTLVRRYKHFGSVHDSLRLLRAKARLALPTKEARERRKSFAKRKQDVPRFPKTPDSLVRGGDNLEERRQQLEGYMQAILRCPQFRNHPETLKFLEVCHLSFVAGLGPKLKEGMVEKRAGGRRIALHCCCVCCQPGHWQHRYLILKDTFVAYLRPQDGTVSDVLLMDRDFSVSYGGASTGVRNGLLISNLSRHLLLKCWTYRKTREWYEAIQATAKESGGDFVENNRYGSFVPLRLNCYVNWFVDGASYMAAVADGLEAAKEEIFITDWMLSPELFLKRPAIEGDKWRLDKILERKAGEGVRIFILVYKEMEMAVGINSYYTKSTLSKLHPTNIKVMRHPDGIKLWSHHEKCVVIDQRLAFLGGIDLCYGRWDTRTHRLTDINQSQLTTFYGHEDAATLQNVLNNIPNIVPRLLDIAKIRNNNNASNNTDDDNKVAGLFARLANPQRQTSQLESIAEDGRMPGCSGTSPGQVEVSVHREVDGGYANPVLVADDEAESESSSHSGGSTGSRRRSKKKQHHRGLSEDSRTDRKLVRQKYTIADEQRDEVDDSHTSREPAASSLFAKMVPQQQQQRIDGENEPAGLPDDGGNTTLHTFLKMVSSRPQDIVSRLAANAAVLTSAATSAETDAASDLSAAGTRAMTTSNVQADGCLTDEQKVAMFGQQATSAKPTTPKQKRKADGYWELQREGLEWQTEMIKAVADFRIMFQKHKAESIDVTDDNSSRPFDQSVYEAKEKGADAEYDAQLARQGLCGPLKIWVGKDYVNFIFKDFVELDNPFADMVDRTVTPRMPWHDIASCVFGKPARDVARHFIQRWNFTKLEKRKTNPGIPMLLPKSNSSVSVPRWATNSAFNCNCQILRSSCEWSAGIKHTECSILNAYIDLIHTSKHYIYIENQFFISIDNDSVVHNPIGTALYERIIQAYKNDETFRVYVIMPLLPAFEGDVGAKSGTSIQAVVHWNYASICRGGKSLLERLANKLPNPFKYVSFYGLRKHEEMCGNLTTELIYVHSKLLIVDDQSVIIASANINDRSMLGNRDSELGILVQDTCTVDSVMDGKPYKAGAFACSLRKSLFREHLGVAADDRTIDVSDPTSTEFYTNTWLKLASVNTSIYDKVFCCVPTDAVRTLHALHEYQRRPVLAQADPGEARQQLLKVRGYLVLLPLHFLCDETLTPAPGTKEALAPTVIWT